MIKIWGKIISHEKVMKSTTISVDTKESTFFEMLRDLCGELNVPTPVLLDKHVYDFNVFRLCIFKPDDFVESVVFDRLVLEVLNSD